MFIKVCDNVISEKYSKYLFEQVTNLKWTFVPNLSYGHSETNYKTAGFSYLFYLDKKYNNKENSTIISKNFKIVIPLLLEAFEKFDLNLDLNNVFRSRARLTLNRDVSFVEDKHIDYKQSHLVLLYYFNTTDGDTVFYQNDSIVESISPKRGRGVLFDGSIFHASSASTLSPRIVLNTNININ